MRQSFCPNVSLRFVLVVLLTAFGCSFQFFNNSAINQPEQIVEEWIIDSYQNRYNQSISQSHATLLYSVITSQTLLGSVVGSCIMPILAENIGRRNSLIASSVVSIIGSLLSGTSVLDASPEQLIVGRLLIGVNIGVISGLVPMYLTESAPVKFRGAAGTVHQLFVAAGDTLSLIIGIPQLLGSKTRWPSLVSLAGICSVVLCIFLPFCSESPRYLLITKKRKDLAEKSVRFFNIESSFDETMAQLEAEKRRATFLQYSRQSTFQLFRQLCSRPDLRIPLLLSILIMIGQQFTGVVAIFMYSTSIFIQAGLSLDQARWSTVGIAIAYMSAVVLSIYLIEAKGRRQLLIFQYSGCITCLIILAILNATPNTKIASYCSVAVVVVYMLVYGVGCAIPWLITSELFSQNFRAIAVSISTVVSWTLGFIISIVYLPYRQAVGSALSLIPFIIVTLIVLFCVLLVLPETKGKTIDEILSEFKSRKRNISGNLRKLTIDNDSDEAEEIRRTLLHSKSVDYGARGPFD